MPYLPASASCHFRRGFQHFHDWLSAPMMSDSLYAARHQYFAAAAIFQVVFCRCPCSERMRHADAAIFSAPMSEAAAPDTPRRQMISR